MTRPLHALAAAALILAAVLTTVGLVAGPPQPAAAQALEAWRVVDVWASDPGPRPAGFIRQPAGVAVDDAGTAYVVDTARGMVHVMRAGAWADVYASRGSGSAQLLDPHGIAVLGGRLLVADTGNRRIQVFRVTGEHVTAWTDVGTPWDVAVADMDRIYVSDHEGDRVVVLDGDGTRVGEIGTSGGAFGALAAPTGIAAWPDGRLAVVDAGNNRVQVRAADGTLLQVITNTTTSPLVDTAALDDGRLLVSSLRYIHNFELATLRASLAVAPVPGAFLGLAVGPASTPVSTTIWASLTQDDRTGIRRYDRATFGTATDWIDLPAPPGELVSPRRIAIADDTAYVLDAAPRIQRLRTDGTPLGQTYVALAAEVAPVSGDDIVVASGGAVRRLAGMTETWAWQPVSETVWLAALDRDGRAGRSYALDVRQQVVHTLADDGTRVVTHPLGIAGDRTYEAVTDLAVRSDGDLLIVNRGRAEVEHRTAAGALGGRWPVTGVPLRVAGASDAGAFVLTREGWVWRLGPDGSVRAWWDAAADAPETPAEPSDLAVGADGRVYVLDARGGRVLVFARDPGRPAPIAPVGRGCTFVRDKWAAPSTIRLGETVGVTLTVAGRCLDQGQGTDVVLVLDRSGSMVGRKIEAARAATVAFLGEMDFSVSRVGLVVFNTEATAPISLTTDARAVIDAAVGFGVPVGGTDIGEGIQLAARELSAAGRPGIAHVIVVLSDGRPEGADVDAGAAAAAAKADGIRLFTIGFGADTDPVLMESMASSPTDYFLAPSTAELYGIYTEIARRISGGIVARTAVITDVVPVNMTYLVGSAVPPVVSYVDNTLRWELRDVRADLRLHYRLRPQQVGTWPTNVDARMRYRDGLDEDGELVFPVPRVVVLGPPPTPGPPVPLYLPLLARYRCIPLLRHSDVALVLDTSSTMTGDKLAAAKAAARLFVDRIELPADRAAIIGFNRDARLATGLTGDRAVLHAAIDGLFITPGTVIDGGLRAAADELTGPRALAGRTKVIVLLSDGLNNAGPDPVRAAASEARGHGIVLYAVAFGADADVPFLVEIAGDARRTYVALRADDLERIYGEIAEVIVGCP